MIILLYLLINIQNIFQCPFISICVEQWLLNARGQINYWLSFKQENQVNLASSRNGHNGNAEGLVSMSERENLPAQQVLQQIN